MTRPNSAPDNELGNKSFYCRSCGLVMKKAGTPDICTFCGSILSDQGFGISGDNSVSETSVSTYAGRGYVVTNVDKGVH